MAAVLAPSGSNRATAPLRLSPKSISLLEQYLKGILEIHKQTVTPLHNKMEVIDQAYARYQLTEDKEAGKAEAGVELNNVIVPVVISQVDSFVAHLADVYLSGYPVFPVVSTPTKIKEAEMLESIIDTHATVGGYARQFLLAFRDGIKYNFMPIEHSWEPIQQYQIVSDYLRPRDAAKLEEKSPSYTKIRRLDPYNTVWDLRVDPAEVCYNGEFAGYIDIPTRIPLKRFINSQSQSGNLYNIGKIGASTFAPDTCYYREPPEINETINRALKSNAGRQFNWLAYLGAAGERKGLTQRTLLQGLYERFTCYARIIPSEFEINDVPRKNSPQIWKFMLINGTSLLYAERIYTAYDVLPILIGQPLEDGLGLQTKSIAENQLGFQDAVSTLMNIRFNSARRAVSDRAIYDSTLINESDINAPIPAPKIPVRLSGLNNKTLDHAYKQIPFDGRGTDGVVGDMSMLLDFADRSSGLNKPSRGEFQRGNKSVQEWSDTMSGAEERKRLPAIMTEFQVMIPIKESMKQNIYQKGVQGPFQNFRTGDVYEIKPEDIENLRKNIMSFKIGDGHTPKSKLASTDFLARLIDSLSQNQLLAQSWGPGLPRMFAHLASLGGVKNLDQYLPPVTNQQQLPQGQNGTGTPTPQT